MNPKLNSRNQSRYRSARLSDIKIVIPVLPSSGGTGIRLKVPRGRFSTKKMLRNVVANVSPEAIVDSGMCLNDAVAGGGKPPVPQAPPNPAPGRNNRGEFAPGPR